MSPLLTLSLSLMPLLVCAALGCASRTTADRGDSGVLAIPPRAETLPGPAEDAAETLMGVRVAIAVNSWDGPDGELLDKVLPVHVTLDNGSPVRLQIAPTNFTLVSTTSDRTFRAVPPHRLLMSRDEPTRTTLSARMLALGAGELQPGGKRSGFLFFERPETDVLGVRLQVPLINVSGEHLGVIEIPLTIEAR